MKELGEHVVLFAHITSRIEGEKHGDLLTQKGGRGFPTTLLLDAEGEIVATVSEQTIPGIKGSAVAVAQVAALSEKKDRTLNENIEYLLARLKLGQLSLDEAQAEKKALGDIPNDAHKSIDAALLSLEISERVEAISSQEQAIEAGKLFASMIEEGKAPMGAGITTVQFWIITSEHAFAESDRDLFRKCIDGVKAGFENNEQYASLYAQMESRLGEIKDKK